MIYRVKYWPDPALREIADVITDFEEIQKVNDELFETMYAQRGIGLSATQCAIKKRIFVMDTLMDGTGQKETFINPTIKENEGSIIYPEGCLSFPNIYVNVERASKILISYTNIDGEAKEQELEGLDAVCAQHELDHLNGIVFFDYLSGAKRQRAEQKLRKELKRKRKQK